MCVYILGPKKPKGVKVWPQKKLTQNREQHTSTSHNRQAKTGPSTNLNIQPLGVATQLQCNAVLREERLSIEREWEAAHNTQVYTFLKTSIERKTKEKSPQGEKENKEEN